jgi:hypothetical protein
MAHRVIRYAGSAVSLEYEGERAAGVVEYLFGFVRDERGNNSPPSAGYRVAPGREPGSLVLFRESEQCWEGEEEGVLAEQLLGAVCRDLVESSGGGLVFHAGALSWRGKAVVIPGAVAAGKTTLTLWLTRKGLRYLTDEMVFFEFRDLKVQAFARPLNLKKPSRKYLGGIFDFERHERDIITTSAGYLISPGLLDDAVSPARPPVGLFLFPRYSPEKDAEILSLSGAQTGLELIKCLVNARNLPDHGFGATSRLGASAPAYLLRYSRFDQIQSAVDRLLAEI